MTVKFDDLLAEVLRLSAQDRARLLAVLKTVQTSAEDATRDCAVTSAETNESDPMTHVTVALPDDLVEQAQDAGLLAGSALEELIRRALQKQSRHAAPNIAPGQERRLVRGELGFLVVEGLPGEKPITFEEIRQILNTMEW